MRGASGFAVDAPVGHAPARPALGRFDQPAAHLVELVIPVGKLSTRDLDSNLVQRGLGVLADLVPLLGDDATSVTLSSSSVAEPSISAGVASRPRTCRS